MASSYIMTFNSHVWEIPPLEQLLTVLTHMQRRVPQRMVFHYLKIIVIHSVISFVSKTSLWKELM